MKKNVIMSVGLMAMGLAVFSLSGCGSKTEKAVLSIADGQEQISEISEKLMNGEISNEEADKLTKDITENMEPASNAMKDAYKNVSDFKGVPNWAKKIGIHEIKGFDIVNGDSFVAEYSKKNHMPESLNLVYSYDDEAKAIKAAEKLAGEIGLKEAKHSPRKLQEDLNKTMKSMMEYMSDEDKTEYEKNKMSGYIADGEKGDYYIMISALDGKLSIIVNNNTQMAEIMK